MSRPEARVEQALTAAAKRHGGQCLKFVSPGLPGVMDRLLILPLAERCPGCGQRARHALIEAKANGEVPEPLQNAVAARLHSSGAHTSWVDSKTAAVSVVEALATGHELRWA